MCIALHEQFVLLIAICVIHFAVINKMSPAFSKEAIAFANEAMPWSSQNLYIQNFSNLTNKKFHHRSLLFPQKRELNVTC